MAATPLAPIYLDHAATTPLRPEVAAAMASAQAEAWGNPSSPHGVGRAAKRTLEDCRERILGLLGCRSSGVGRDRLVFTSGATEANRLAILGMAAARTGIFASSARDHSSIRSLRRELAGRGWGVAEIPLGADGRVDATWTLPAPGNGLIATTLVCGQSGAIDDPLRIAAAHPAALVHVDATQAVLTQSVSFAELRCATLTLAPHKFAGPRGIGAVVVRGDVPFDAVVPGVQEAGLRGGTEPVVLVAGFLRALELAVADRERTAERLTALRERFAAEFIAAAAGHGLAVRRIIDPVASSPHVLVLAVLGIDRQAFVMAADLAGVCCGTGTACASGSSEPAPALAAMGLPPALTGATLRFSFGRTTTAEEITMAISRLAPLLLRLGTRGEVGR